MEAPDCCCSCCRCDSDYVDLERMKVKMLVKISEDRFVNTDHIALIQPMIWKDKDLYHVMFSYGHWTIQVTQEDRDLIVKAME